MNTDPGDYPSTPVFMDPGLRRDDGSWIPASSQMAYERPMRALLLAPLVLLAACEPEPENIQAKAENMSRQLEERANQIEAEAEKDVDLQAAPLENEADLLLNQIAANVSGNGTAEPANAQ